MTNKSDPVWTPRMQLVSAFDSKYKRFEVLERADPVAQP